MLFDAVIDALKLLLAAWSLHIMASCADQLCYFKILAKCYIAMSEGNACICGHA